MSTIKLRWEVTKATAHDYWANNNILRIYIRYDVQAGKMFWESCPINGGSRAKNGIANTMPEAIAAAEDAALQMLMEDLEVVPTAGIVLEWEWADIQASDRRMDTRFNEWITAHIFTLGTLTEPQRAKVTVGHLEIWETFAHGTTLSDAQNWCTDTIQSITTQSPRP
jgi:hypothetical protein